MNKICSCFVFISVFLNIIFLSILVTYKIKENSVSIVNNSSAINGNGSNANELANRHSATNNTDNDNDDMRNATVAILNATDATADPSTKMEPFNQAIGFHSKYLLPDSEMEPAKTGFLNCTFCKHLHKKAKMISDNFMASFNASFYLMCNHLNGEEDTEWCSILVEQIVFSNTKWGKGERHFRDYAIENHCKNAFKCKE